MSEIKALYSGISTGSGGTGGSFRFYNTNLRDKNKNKIDGRAMSIWDFLDVIKLNDCTPILMIGVAGKKGWW